MSNPFANIGIIHHQEPTPPLVPEVGVNFSAIKYGTDGNDLLEGKDTDDVIFGLAGDDTIHGRNGNDDIYGDEGDDVISGGFYGTDTLTGGAGADIFQFEGFWTGEVDTITDYNPDEGDRITIRSSPFQYVFSQHYNGENTPESLPGQLSLDGIPTLGYSTNGELYYDLDGSGSSYTLQKIAQIVGAPEFSSFQIEGAIYI